MWADNETDQDLLGFSIHADLLLSIITDPDMLPVTVGLFGDWGGGKSSILRILQRNLAQNEEFAVVYFNSWIFEGYEDAKAAVLSSLLQELQDHRDLKNVIGDEAKALLKRVNWMKLLRIGASVGMSYLTANPLPFFMASGLISSNQPKEEAQETAEPTDLPDVKWNELLKTPEATVQNIRSFRSDFQKLIDKTGLRCLIVLIDDLDRCSPERLIENLEAIKLFLNVDRTAFVIATDRRIVENAIRIRYSELFSGERANSANNSLVTDYLEKLIQVPYTLPKLAPHEVRSYLCLLFLQKHLPDADFNKVFQKYTEFLTKERYISFQLGDEINTIEDDQTRNAVTESIRLVEACSDAITDGLKGNPRQIKRFLNAFWLRRELARIAQLTHLLDHFLIKMMVLEYISEERFEELYQWHSQSPDGTVQQLIELEEAENTESVNEQLSSWTTYRIWRWLKTDPSLAKVDLRDYFWVARSAIADTFSGVRLMTQTMKICSEELTSTVDAERQNGVSMFLSLSEDEQESVVATVARHAMQTPSNSSPLRSLMDIAKTGHLIAAQAFARCINRIGAANLNAGFGVTLRAFSPQQNNRAVQVIIDVREELEKTDTKVGRALQAKRKTRK